MNTLIPFAWITRRRLVMFFILFPLLPIIASIAFILLLKQQELLAGILFAVAALLSYTAYSLFTELTLQQHRIDIRYPYLLFQSGLFLGIIGLCLLLVVPWSSFWSPLSILAIAYVITCVCIPHTLYSALLKKARFKHFTDFQLLEVPVAIFFEIVLLQTILHPMVYLGIGVTLILLLLTRWQWIMLSAEP